MPSDSLALGAASTHMKGDVDGLVKPRASVVKISSSLASVHTLEASQGSGICAAFWSMRLSKPELVACVMFFRSSPTRECFLVAP